MMAELAAAGASAALAEQGHRGEREDYELDGEGAEWYRVFMVLVGMLEVGGMGKPASRGSSESWRGLGLVRAAGSS